METALGSTSETNKKGEICRHSKFGNVKRMLPRFASAKISE